MKRALWRAGNREIGGVLMGKQLAPGDFELVDFSLDEVSGGRAHFVRDVEHHTKALSSFFERTGHVYGQYNYLGEWHSHPRFELTPSGPDITSMQELIRSERNIDFAVLMIVRTSYLFKLGVNATLHTRVAPITDVTITYY
jgi:[CysO sulfur-carrier protein]-S-L-cysteine hydrolase